jgi:hypothetical protein
VIELEERIQGEAGKAEYPCGCEAAPSSRASSVGSGEVMGTYSNELNDKAKQRSKSRTQLRPSDDDEPQILMPQTGSSISFRTLQKNRMRSLGNLRRSPASPPQQQVREAARAPMSVPPDLDARYHHHRDKVRRRRVAVRIAANKGNN